MESAEAPKVQARSPAALRPLDEVINLFGALLHHRDMGTIRGHIRSLGQGCVRRAAARACGQLQDLCTQGFKMFKVSFGFNAGSGDSYCWLVAVSTKHFGSRNSEFRASQRRMSSRGSTFRPCRVLELKATSATVCVMQSCPGNGYIHNGSSCRIIGSTPFPRTPRPSFLAQGS